MTFINTGETRRHKLCPDCREDRHDHHVGAKCLTIVDEPPRDFVCLCLVDRDSLTTVVKPHRRDLDLRALLLAIAAGPEDGTVYPGEIVCRRCDVPVSDERDACPFCEMPINPQVVLIEATSLQRELEEAMPIEETLEMFRSKQQPAPMARPKNETPGGNRAI